MGSYGSYGLNVFVQTYQFSLAERLQDWKGKEMEKKEKKCFYFKRCEMRYVTRVRMRRD